MAERTITKVVRFDEETLEALAPLVAMAKDLRRIASQIETVLGGIETVMRLELQSLDFDGDEDLTSEREPPLYFTS